MDDFKIECYISSSETEEKKILSIDKKTLESLINSTEVRALSEYYSKKINVISNKN